MPIPALDIIYNKADLMGLKIINAISIPDNVMKIDIISTDNNETQELEVFLELVKNLGQTFLFIDVTIYNEELCDEFSIDIEAIDEKLYGSSYKSIVKAAKEHNRFIKSLPMDKPAYLEMFVYSQGCLYTKDFSEEWYNQLNDPEEILDSIIAQYFDDINSFRAQKEQTEFRRKKDLENRIIGDPTFKTCTTKAARMAFVQELIIEQGEDLPINRASLEGWCDLLLAKSKSNH